MSDTAAPDQYFDSLVGTKIKDLYAIERKIGVGGMGAVFEGRQIYDGNRVAIKVVSPQLAAKQRFIKRFQREAKVGWVLSHPNIVKVHEFGETPDGLFYMTMEFVEGETLKAYLARMGALSPERSLELLKQICEGLAAAHRRNILHRDLKPENILITQPEHGKEILKLADFGLVKLTEPDSEITQGANLTEVGEIFGTPIYMAPEQILSQPIKATADIYSVGVIFYQMLTAKVPLEDPDLKKLLLVKVSKDIEPPSKRFPFVHADFDAVFLKVLARHPEDRYQSVQEFYAAVQKVVEQVGHHTAQPTQPLGLRTDDLFEGSEKADLHKTTANVDAMPTVVSAPSLNTPSHSKVTPLPSETPLADQNKEKKWWEFWKR